MSDETRITFRVEDDLDARLKAYIDSTGVNRSNFIREAIEAALNRKGDTPDPMDPNVIVRLTEALCGQPKAARMKRQMERVTNQPELLGEWLEIWLRQLEDKHLHAAEGPGRNTYGSLMQGGRAEREAQALSDKQQGKKRPAREAGRA